MSSCRKLDCSTTNCPSLLTIVTSAAQLHIQRDQTDAMEVEFLPSHDLLCCSGRNTSTGLKHIISAVRCIKSELGHLKVIQLLGDLLASFANKELLAFEDGSLKLLKAKEARDGLKFAKEPLT